MRLKRSVVICFLIFAITKVNSKNFEDVTGKVGAWDFYNMHSIAHPSHKISRPLPSPTYIGLLQNPIDTSTAQYEYGDVSQNVALMESSTSSSSERAPTPETTNNPPMGQVSRPTLPPRPNLRPTQSNAASVLIQNPQQQPPDPNNQANVRPTLPSRPIWYATSDSPTQAAKSDLSSYSYQPGRPKLPRPMIPVPRPVPQPTLINTITPPNPTIEPVTQPITNSEIKVPIGSNTAVTPFLPGRPILLNPPYPMRPIPRPVPRPTLINTIPPTKPILLEPIPEPTTTLKPDLIKPTEAVVPSNILTSYPIQSGRPTFPIRPIPRPIPKPTLISSISPTNPTLIEPESSDPAPNNEPAPSSELSVASVTESTALRPSYPSLQRPILPAIPIILKPIPITPGQAILTHESLSTVAPLPPRTEAPPASTRVPINEIEITTKLVPLPGPQPLPAPLPPSYYRPISTVGRPTLQPRPIQSPSDNVIVMPRPIHVPSVRPEPLIPEPITMRPTLPSRPISTFPSYNPPMNRPAIPTRPPLTTFDYSNTTPIMGKTVGDVDIDSNPEISVKPKPVPAVTTPPSAPFNPLVPNKPNYEGVTYPQRPLLPPATSSPIQQPVQSYLPIPTDTEILRDYRCPHIDGFFSIANECDSYVECKKNIAIKYSCPDGLHFNPNAIWPEYACAYPSEVKCNHSAVQNAPRPSALCPRQYGYFPSIDGDCSRFTLCQEGLATTMNCPSGLAFNLEKNSCDWPANVPTCKPSVFQDFTCPMPPALKDGSRSDLIYKFRYGNRCRDYIACQHGHPRLLSCDSGLHFDESSESCIISDNVKSCEQ